MARTINYTLFAFEINMLIDRGERISVDEVKERIKAGDLFEYLVNNYQVDVSIFTAQEKKDMLEFFTSMYENVDSRRKFGIEKEGLTLLIAYCIEWLQENRSDK